MPRGFIAKLAALIHQYRLENIDEVQGWLRLIELGLMDEDLAEALVHRCRAYIDQRRRKPNYLAAPPTWEELYAEAPCDVVLGKLVDCPDVAIGIRMHGAVHCIFAGTTESGKTVALRRMILAVQEYNSVHPERPIVIIVLDRKGRDFADVVKLLGNKWRHYDVDSSLRLGLQPPSGVPPGKWISHVAETFCARAGLVAARITLANVMRTLVGAMNNPNTERPLFPDFRLILEALRRVSKRAFAEKDAYTDSLTHWLEDVVQGTGSLFQNFRGLDLEEDLIGNGLNAVIAMPQMSPLWISHFIADLFVLQLHLGRSYRGHLVDGPDVLLIIDEADDDVAWQNERRFETGMSPICRGMRQLREFGVGICLAVGALNPVSQHVLNSAKYKFVFAMNSGACIDTAAGTLMLPHGAEAIIPALQPGECLFRSPYWPHAMLTRIDFVQPHRSA